jgi:hypothetical protein
MIIPLDKLKNYLLIPQKQNDKSKYLAMAGFTQENPVDLLNAIQELAQNFELIEDVTNEYGTFYRIDGTLHGVNQYGLEVVTIWLKQAIDEKYRFITLKPKKGDRNVN